MNYKNYTAKVQWTFKRVCASGRYWKVISSIALVVVLFHSCVKDSFDVNKMAQIEWNPKLAVPLAYSSMTLEKILNKPGVGNIIHKDSNNFLTVAYNASLFKQDASGFVKLEDFSTDPMIIALTPTETSFFDNPIANPVGSNYDIGRTEPIALTPDSMPMDSIKFNSGRVNISITSGMAHDLNILITIPKAKKNGVPLTKTIILIYKGAASTTATSTIELGGYTFDMTSGSVPKKIDLTYKVTFTKKVGTSTGQISILQSYEDLSFKNLFGDFGKISLSPGKSTMPLTIFANSKGKSAFSIANVKMKLNIYNSFGLPIAATIKELYGTSDGVITSALPSSGPITINIDNPKLSLGELGKNKKSTISLDALGVDIAKVINSRPQNLVYNIDIKANPNGPPAAGDHNFILDTSGFNADMELEIPLEGSVSNMTFQDTVPFTFGATVEQLESMLLRTIITNGFPFEVKMQVYFCDSVAGGNFIRRDSLFNNFEVILPSAVVSPVTNKVTASSTKSTDIIVTAAQMAKLSSVNKLIIIGKMSTYDGNLPVPPKVKIYSDYKLDLKLAGQVQLKAKF